MTDHLSNADLRAWARFYARLTATAAWNGARAWARVALGGTVAHTVELVDVRLLGWAGTGATLAGAVLLSIAEALFRFPLPEPKPPEPKRPEEVGR